MNEVYTDFERPKPEPETVGTWKGKDHSHIAFDGSNCEILDEDQWTTIQSKIKELQDLLKINIGICYFYIDETLNKKNGK